MDDRRRPECGQIQEILTAQARIWGRLALLRDDLARQEQELAGLEARLRQDVRDVEKLEHMSLSRLAAWIRGKLPQTLSERQQEVIDVLVERDEVLRRISELRTERDRLEARMDTLRTEEARFSGELVARLRETESQRVDQPPGASRREDRVRILAHDLDDLEVADQAMQTCSRHLEEAHDQLARIEVPGLLASLSGMALLDLFEREEVQRTRDALEEARGEAQRAIRALRTLDSIRPPAASLAALQDLERHRFLASLYHEGQIRRVLHLTKEAVEQFRTRIFDARTAIRTLRDGILVELAEPTAPP